MGLGDSPSRSCTMEPALPLPYGGHRGSSGHPRNLCPSRRAAAVGVDQEDRAAAAERWPRVAAASGSTAARSSPARPAARRSPTAPPRTCSSSCCASRRATSSSTPTSMADSPGSRGRGRADARRGREDARRVEVDRGGRAVARGWVALAPELPDDEITVDRDRWRLLVAVGGGITRRRPGRPVRAGRAADLPQVKELVEPAWSRRARPRSVPGSPRSTAAPVFEPEPAPAFEPGVRAVEPSPMNSVEETGVETRGTGPSTGGQRPQRLRLARPRRDGRRARSTRRASVAGGPGARGRALRSSPIRPTRPRSPASSPTSAPRRPRPSPRRPRPPRSRSAKPLWPRSTTTRSRSTASLLLKFLGSVNG